MKRKILLFIITMVGLTFISCSSQSSESASDKQISLLEIPGIIVPIQGAIPVISVIDTVQYTGIMTWSPETSQFAASTIYTASIILSPKTGFTLNGVSENSFTVAGGMATNASNSGIISVVFPRTGLATDKNITFSGVTQVGGTSDSVTTYSLTLAFSDDPTSLSVNDITITGATKGVLTGTGTTRNLTISDITVFDGETVSVAVASPLGYLISGSPQTAVVYKISTVIGFSGISQVGGTPNSLSTTSLNLTFGKDPTSLSISDITVTGATKGVLTGTGTTRNLTITDITVSDGATVSVAVASPHGYLIVGSPLTAVVYKAPSVISFSGVTQVGGTSNSTSTTSLNLTFSGDPSSLSINDITVTGATKDLLTGTGTTRNLTISAITVANGATVSIAIASPHGFSITGSPRTVVVYKEPTPITFSGVTQVGGISNSVTTTSLTLTFSRNPTSLSANDITVTGATKGVLTGTGTTRNLNISSITVSDGETVSVAVASPVGFSIIDSPKTAVIYKAPTVVAFSGLTQVGGISNSVSTTSLNLTFSEDPTNLSINNITVTGATKGVLTGTGTTRNLTISAITVANGETVSIAIANPFGFAINGTPKTVVVYKEPIPIAFSGVTQVGGTSNSVTTTSINLTFSGDPSNLSVNDITVTGATKGVLTGTGTSRNLTISAITVYDGATVSIAVASPPGYLISDSPQTAVVYTAFEIGTAYQGGKIAYILMPGDIGYEAGVTHGLVAATTDVGVGIGHVGVKWALTANCSVDVPGAHGMGLGSGMANTNAIVAQNGAGTTYAAGLCDAYTNIDTGTGVYSDWYLPSYNELEKLYLNRVKIGGFQNDSYWSSTCNNSTTVYYVNFLNSFRGTLDKLSNPYIRPIRSF